MTKTPATTQPSCTELIEINRLKSHEKVDSTRLRELEEEIKSDGILKIAIAIDKDSNVILDGHHRVAALKALGCKRVPVIFVDYSSPHIDVQCRRCGMCLTKKDIIEAALNSKHLPPKTSYHMVRICNVWKHISEIQTKVNIPLEKLT